MMLFQFFENYLNQKEFKDETLSKIIGHKFKKIDTKFVIKNLSTKR